MPTRNEIENICLYTSDDLCKMAEVLGYKDTGRFAINQLQCNNGSYASSLLRFLDDNPGCLEVIHEWILNNMKLTEDENLDEG